MAAPPLKAQRKLCYESRDNYWKCLEKGYEDKQCLSLKKLYESTCPQQWVDHFERQRQLEIYKKNFDYSKIKGQAS